MPLEGWQACGHDGHKRQSPSCRLKFSYTITFLLASNHPFRCRAHKSDWARALRRLTCGLRGAQNEVFFLFSSFFFQRVPSNLLPSIHSCITQSPPPPPPPPQRLALKIALAAPNEEAHSSQVSEELSDSNTSSRDDTHTHTHEKRKAVTQF